MTLLLHRNDIGEDVRSPVSLPPRRRRLSTIAKQHRPKGRAFLVSVHRKGSPLQPSLETIPARADWKNTLVGPNDTVIITTLPLGGMGGGRQGGSGKAIGGAIAMIALAVAAPYLVGLIGGPMVAAGGGLSLLGKVVAMGIVAGGSYFLSKAATPKANKTVDRPVYGVSGGGNLPRAGDRIPKHYGRVWSQPDLSMPSYFVYDGDDQLLFQRMTIGVGKYSLHGIRVGDATMMVDNQLIAPFTTAQWELIQPGQRSTLVPGKVYSAQSVSGSELPHVDDNPNWMGPYPCCPKGETTKHIQIDFSLPQGAYSTHPRKSGNLPMNWGIRCEYAKIDEDDRVIGPWQQLLDEGQSAQTTRALRYTRVIQVPEGRYAVRARNRNEKIYDYLEQQGIRAVDMIMWDGLRSYLDSEPLRPDVTEIALKIRSGKATGNITSFNDIWVDTTSILPSRSGNGFVERATNNAIDVALDILRNDAYGAGVPDSKIELDVFSHYKNLLTENNTFDGSIRGPVAVTEALATVLGVIRAEPVIVGDVWSMVRDEARTMRKHVVTRRQIVKDTSGVEFDLDMSDGSSDVIVEYFVDGDPNKRSEQRITIGAETMTPRRINVFGVSNHKHAIMLARWYAASAYYRRESRLFTTEMAGRNLQRNDAAIIDTWFLDEPVVVGVEEQNGWSVTLDTDVPLPAGAHAMFRNEQGLEWGPVAVTAGATPDIIVVNASDAGVIQNWTGQSFASLFTRNRKKLPVSVRIGTITEISEPYIIRTTKPDANGRVQVSAVYDDPQVWAILGEAPPPAPPIGAVVANENKIAPILPWVRGRVVQKATAVVLDWSVGIARGATRYAIDVSYGTDSDEWENAYTGPQTEGSYPVHFRANTVLRVRARAFNAAGVRSDPVYTVCELLKPTLDDEIAYWMVRIDQMQEQLRKDIEYNSKVGRETLEGALKDLRERVERLGQVSTDETIDTFNDREWAERQTFKLEAAVGDNRAMILQEASVRADENEAVAATLEVLTANVATNHAAIMTEQEARATKDEAIAQQITTLQAEVGENIQAALQEERTARVTQDEVLASSISTMAVRVGTNETAISNEVKARADADTATGQIIQTISSKIDNPAIGLSAVANATNQLKTAVGFDGASATKITTLEAQMAGGVGSVLLTNYSNVQSGLNVARAEFGVAMEIDGRTGGYVMTGARKLDGSVAYTLGVKGELVVDGSILGTKLAAKDIITDTLQVRNASIEHLNIKNGSVGSMSMNTNGNAAVYTGLTVHKGAKVAIVGTVKGSGGAMVTIPSTEGKIRIRVLNPGGAVREEIDNTSMNFFRDIGPSGAAQWFLLATTLQAMWTAPDDGTWYFQVAADHNLNFGAAVLAIEVSR